MPARREEGPVSRLSAERSPVTRNYSSSCTRVRQFVLHLLQAGAGSKAAAEPKKQEQLEHSAPEKKAQPERGEQQARRPAAPPQPQQPGQNLEQRRAEQASLQRQTDEQEAQTQVRRRTRVDGPEPPRQLETPGNVLGGEVQGQAEGEAPEDVQWRPDEVPGEETEDGITALCLELDSDHMGELRFLFRFDDHALQLNIVTGDPGSREFLQSRLEPLAERLRQAGWPVARVVAT